MNIVGIDLGTTFSGLAVFNELGTAEIIPNSEGERITPSIVFFEPDEEGEVLVGEMAKQQMRANPDHVIVEVKREMGFDTTFSVGGRSYTPVNVSSKILRKLIQDAERTQGKIEEVVVTHPARFDERARRAIRDAAKEAGVKVTLVEEPVAAALYYATRQPVQGCTLIFDLGGGTLDVAIARVGGSQVDILSKEGDLWLGGKDFDREVAGLINAQYRKKSGKALFDESPDLKLMFMAENFKKILSSREKHEDVIVGPGGHPEEIEITRAQFEAAIESYLGRIQLVIDLALEDARGGGIAESEVDQVLLVGGSTRIPCVRELLKKRFGRELEESVNVDESVALGAAINAGLNAEDKLNQLQQDALDSIHIMNVASLNFGTMAKGKFSVIIPRNTPIPCSKTKHYVSLEQGQTAVDCSVVQSPYEEADPEYLEELSNAKMTDLPPGRPAGQEFTVTYSYDKEGMIHCEFRDKGTGRVEIAKFEIGMGEKIDFNEKSRGPDDSKCDPGEWEL